MSDCGDQHDDRTWTPATRCRRCGHRTGNDSLRPRATRRMPVRYWIFELAARWIATHPVAELERRDRRPA